MILTGNEIKREVLEGNIIIEPFDIERINPNSYNYRLGDTYIELDDEVQDSLSPSKEPVLRDIPSEGLLLKPNKVYLCTTFEIIGSKNYVTSLIGKSSMGRLGLFLQISADLGHQNEIHKWTLELRACQPTIIYPRMLIGQVTFWATEGEQLKSKGYYHKYDTPKVSLGTEKSKYTSSK